MRMIVIVMFHDESVSIERRRYRVDLLGSSGASRVAFVVHCFDRGNFLQRVLLSRVMCKCNSGEEEDYGKQRSICKYDRVEATLSDDSLLGWVGKFHFGS